MPTVTPVTNVKQEKPVTRATNAPKGILTYEFRDPNSLPSRMLPYPEGTVFEITPYTMGEFNNISGVKLPESDIVNIVLRGIYNNLDTDIRYTLTYPDYYFIALQRKLLSLGPQEFTVKTTHNEASFDVLTGCDDRECGKINETKFQNKDLAFKNLFEGIPLEKCKLPLKVTFQGIEGDVVLRFSTLSIGKYLDLKYIENVDFEDGLNSAAAFCVEHDSFKKNLEAIQSLPPTNQNFQLLNAVIEYLNHGLMPNKITCSQCGGIYEVALDNVLEAVVRPFRADKQHSKSTTELINGIQFES